MLFRVAPHKDAPRGPTARRGADTSEVMNTILKLRSARVESQPQGRVLAIESDPARLAVLRHIFETHVGADFQIVQSVNDALMSIAHQMPDLVLTSTFLPPREEATLMLRLKELQGAEGPQVITTPYFIDWEDASSERGKFVRFWRRRRSLMRPACDSETVGRQIEAYLQQVRARRLSEPNRKLPEGPRRPTVLPMRRKSEQGTGGSRFAEVLAPAFGSVSTPARGSDALDRDRRRAKRRISGDLPLLWSVTVPAAATVRVVNISSQGVLLETMSKIPPGRTVDVQVIGEGTDICLPARTTRTEVAAVDGMGVRYRVAAAFSRELEMPGLEPRVVPETVVPTALADLLVRVMREADAGAPPAAVRTTFEHGLRRLLSARDVQIRLAPLVPARDTESIYFTVPMRTERRPILQMVFEPRRPPLASEFKLLKAAVNLAAVVLEFAPLEDAFRKSG